MRVGTHNNTAFGLSFAHDYAVTTHDKELQNSIETHARRLFSNDTNCPLDWEPSGTDFLSPCLEEANLMRKVMNDNEFKNWLPLFLPSLSQPDFSLEPARVSDRTDGKLVHLDGLNFSRAWCLKGITNADPDRYAHLIPIARSHINYSLPNLTNDGYEGGHWLASFAVYALMVDS